MTLYNLEHIEHRYGSRTVLKIDSLRLEAGEIMTIVGPSGAGKSTLLRLMALLEKPIHGNLTVRLDGKPRNASNVSINERRRISMVFQRPVLLSRSVKSNVAVGLRMRGEHNAEARVMSALDRVSMLQMANADAGKLSGGELQRVALARALILEPEILLLDEPTANLDPYNVTMIEDLVRQQNADYGTSVIVVTHNIFQAQRLASNVALLLGGELVEHSPAEQFFNNPRDPRTAAFTSGKLIY